MLFFKRKSISSSFVTLTLVLTFLVLLMNNMREVAAASTMKQVTVTTFPRTVSAVAALTFTIVLNTDYLASGDVLIIYMPSPNVFTPSTSTSLCTSISSTIAISGCSISTSMAQVTFGTLGSATISSFTIKVGNFNNPFSTTPISGISCALTTSAGVTKESGTSSSLNNLVADSMTSAQLTPGDMTVGTASTIVSIKIVTKNAVPSNGQITVQFPFWNPSSSNPTHMIDTTTPTCTGTSPVFKSIFSCTYNTGSKIATLIGPFNAAQSGGTSMTFTISNVVNPYSTAPKSGFVVSTVDSVGGHIDSFTTMTMTVSEWATLTESYINRADGVETVGEQSQIINYFKVPVPVDASCRLRIDFPSDMPVTSTLTSVQGSDLFDSTTQFKTVDFTNNYIELDGCSSYREADAVGLVYLLNILNSAQVKSTASFQYSLYAMSGSTAYKIARQTSDILFTSSAISKGAVSSIVVAAVDSSTVQATTKYAVKFKPAHAIPTNSQIVITFPSTITLTDQTACTLSLVTSAMSTDSGCKVLNNQITLTNPFGSSGKFAANDAALSFVFSLGGTNPYSVKDAGQFEVNTFSTISGINYAIDAGTATNLFTPTPALLTAAVSSVSSYTTYDSPTNYVLKVTPNKIIPSGGIMKVTFPPEVTLASSSLTACKLTVASSTTSLNTCTMTSSSPITLQITNAFSAGYSTVGTPFYLELDGLVNPRTLASTNSFTVSTADSSGNPIESVNSGVVTQMVSVNSLQSITVAPVNTINGQSSDYKITVTTKSPLQSGDKLKLTFPADFTLPSSVSCGTGTSVSSASCSVSANTVTAGLTFSSNPLAAGSTFSFLVKSITNPSNTAPTATFSSIATYDSSNSQLSGYSGSVTTQTTLPATVTSMALSQDDQSFGATTQYQISYSTINAMAAGSSFLITYPSAISVGSNPSPCYVTYASVQYSMNCAVNSNSRTVAVTGPASGSTQLPKIPAGSSIALVMGNIQNPADYQVTVGSMALTSFTDSTFLYKIDNIPNGLVPGTLCSSPCKSCLSSDKTKCVTCFTNNPAIILKYLNSQSCSANCPSNYWADSGFVCHTCPSQCKTCSSDTVCTSCNTGSYPLLYNNFCYAKCPDGSYASSGTCLPCSSNCETCSGSSTTCLTCNQRSDYPYFSSGQCIKTCPTGQVPISNQCKSCNSPCSTCLVDQDTCATCKTGFKYGTKCIASCPLGMVGVNNACQGCDPNCASCSSTDTTKCTLCKSKYLLLNNTCYTSCPSNYVADSARTYCYYSPPAKNETPIVIVPIDNKTIPIVINNTISNVSSNSSIYLYFPATTTQTILAGVAVGSYFKCPTSNVHSSMLGLWGPLELVAYGAQAYLAYKKQISGESTTLTSVSTSSSTKRMLDTLQKEESANIWPLVFYGTLLALAVLIISNLIFMVVLCTVMSDQDYQQHKKQFRGTHWCIHILGSLISYKVGRFLYARFYGGDRFAAPFKNPHRLHNALNCLTILNIVLTLAPIIFVDIYGLIKYKWGDQFYMIIIETLFLALCIIVVSIWEFKAARKIHAPTDGSYSQVNSSLMEEELMKKLEIRLRAKLGGHSIEEFIEKLKQERDLIDEEKGRMGADGGSRAKSRGKTRNRAEYVEPKQRRCLSMIDLDERWRGETKEVDPRQLKTDPLESGDKLQYENQQNPFIKNGNYGGSEQPNNCIAVPYNGPKKVPLNPSQIRVKVIQTGDKVMTGEEYERELDKRMRDLGDNQRQMLEQRKDDNRVYEKGPEGGTGEAEDTKNDIARRKQRDSKMRGRKDKYYEQVDDEDLSFAEDSERAQLMNGTGSALTSKRDDADVVDDLDKIVEEGSGDEAVDNDNNDDDDNYKDNVNVNNSGILDNTQLEEGVDITQSERQLLVDGKDSSRQNDSTNNNKEYHSNELENDILKEYRLSKESSKKALNDKETNQAEYSNQDQKDGNVEFSEEELVEGDQRMNKQQMQLEEKTSLTMEQREVVSDDKVQQNIDLIGLDQKIQYDNDGVRDGQDDFDDDEEDRLNDFEQKKNDDNLKLQQLAEEYEGKSIKFNTTNDIRDQLEAEIALRDKINIEQEAAEALQISKSKNIEDDTSNGESLDGMKNTYKDPNIEQSSPGGENRSPSAESETEIGEVDSDDDSYEKRMKNMVDPEKRRFNVNDILGDLDRDEKGNLLLLQDNQGQLIDKNGAPINEKGYLIDKKTGDVLENKKMGKVFDKRDIDERGEIPPPFNMEKFNFNPHDIRGYFDRDSNGEEVIGNKTNDEGSPIDKLGRMVNQQGYLIDKKGNLIDKRGRVRLHQKFLEMNKGNFPLLFNYKGKKYDIRDVIGDFDKDRTGNIIIRRDKDNHMVDKKGRRVNNKGYLLDERGNVINKDGKVIFDNYALSKDNEIPKFFPFIKFNVDDIKGDFEMDPLGNPMLQRDVNSGELTDNKGRRVNQKGYLLDEEGNIINKRGYKVFSKVLLEGENGDDIPKVFRAGLLRKDTIDSFSQLMNEIEDLEKLQEMEESYAQQQRRQQQKQRRQQTDEEREQERIAKKIEQIIEEDGDDDDLLMKELEELAQEGADGGASEGGNTSVESMMEDTPSNYNIPNQRFMEEQIVRERARQARAGHTINDIEEDSVFDNEEGMRMPGRKLKKKPRKKKKTKKPKETEIDEKDLLMARAYGGMSQMQLDKLLAEKRRREAQLAASDMASQGGGGSKPTPSAGNTMRNASNSRLQQSKFQSSIGAAAVIGGGHSVPRQREDSKMDWDAIDGDGQNLQGFKNAGRSTQQLMPNKQGGGSKKNIKSGRSNLNVTSMQKSPLNAQSKIKKNNLMGSTQNSFNGGVANSNGYGRPESQDSKLGGPKHQTFGIGERGQDDRRLSNVANSVSGFYRDASESKMRSTHESNFAQNIGPSGNQLNEGTARMGGARNKNLQRRESKNDPELERIYGTSKGMADMTMLSDWEKDSQQTIRSGISQMSMINTARVKGLESIYLQRLEPANKGRKTQLKNGKSRKEDRAKFRIMHHKFHDEPEWHADGNRDELDSVISGNYKDMMEHKFREEFQGLQDAKKKKQQADDVNRINIFHGNFSNYKDKMYKQKAVPNLGA